MHIHDSGVAETTRHYSCIFMIWEWLKQHTSLLMHIHDSGVAETTQVTTHAYS